MDIGDGMVYEPGIIKIEDDRGNSFVTYNCKKCGCRHYVMNGSKEKMNRMISYTKRDRTSVLLWCGVGRKPDMPNHDGLTVLAVVPPAFTPADKTEVARINALLKKVKAAKVKMGMMGVRERRAALRALQREKDGLSAAFEASKRRIEVAQRELQGVSSTYESAIKNLTTEGDKIIGGDL
jgi:hypothetical protein